MSNLADLPVGIVALSFHQEQLFVVSFRSSLFARRLLVICLYTLTLCLTPYNVLFKILVYNPQCVTISKPPEPLYLYSVRPPS